MFKKKPNIKTLSPLRSSDRRKTADRIIADFNIRPPPQMICDDGTPAKSEEAVATAAHTALRNMILPDNCLTARFTTTHGPDLKEIGGTIYVGGHGKGEQRILWIGFEGKMYPSVYSLWKMPGLLPLLHTPALVFKKMQGGAHLMAPGIAGPPFPSKAIKGAIVAVASLENPSVPVAVGTCTADISSLGSAQGAKGVAVETFHWFGDEIWDWSTSGKSGNPAPDNLDGWLDEVSGMDEIEDRTNHLDLEDNEEEAGGVSVVAEDESLKSLRNQHVQGEDAITGVVDNDDSEELSTKEIDETFHNAFLYAVHHHKKMHPDSPKHGLNFPLSQSFVLSHLVLPFLPTFTPKQTETLVIKKTSWKNIRKFIKALEKDKLLLAKDKPGNETTVLAIDFDDHAFLDFRPYNLPKRDATTNVSSSKEPSTPENESTDPSIGQKLQRLDLYRPLPAISPLLALSVTPTRKDYARADILALLASYIDNHNLSNTTNKRMIKLDPFLSHAFFNPTKDKLDAELLARGTCPRDVLSDRLLATGCTRHHVILRNDEQPSKPKNGPPPMIEVRQEVRSGSKTVTRVSNLAAYFVPVQPLADELRRVCAGSAAVEMSRSGKGEEVMVQGPQAEAVVAALGRRGVGRNWIEVVKGKGKK